MRILKWVLLFAVAFMVAWVLIFTFTQEPFKTLVPARLFLYETVPIPIYAYVVGAFGAGLLLGLWVALYYFIVQQANLHRKNQQIRALEQELSQAQTHVTDSGPNLPAKTNAGLPDGDNGISPYEEQQ